MTVWFFDPTSREYRTQGQAPGPVAARAGEVWVDEYKFFVDINGNLAIASPDGVTVIPLVKLVP